MPWNERAEILRAIKGVKDVVMAIDNDGTVSKSLIKLKPQYFAKGGDRTRENTPEQLVCRDYKIDMFWNCGGGKIQSSSELVDAVRA